MSNSMKPVYERGAVVIVQKANPMDVQVGDIVQYEATGHSITHRVIAIDLTSDGSGKRVFLMQGDNSPSPDMPVQACLLYTSPSPRDRTRSRMPSSA